MFELLCEYARTFGQDFPISAVMDNSNENGVVQIVQKALAENKPFEVPGKVQETVKSEKKDKNKK